MELFIGCSGFYNSSWKNIFYPEKLLQKKWFQYYASQFNSIEINSSFYRYPKLQVLKKWTEESPEEFLFAIKAPRTVTHYRRFINAEQQLRDFYNLIEEGLNKKLGPVLFQLPASFTYTEERLDQIINTLDPAFLNVVEFRHVSWRLPEIRQALEVSGIIYCNVSHPALPDEPVLPDPAIYLRFHGVPRLFYSGYDDGILAEWAGKIKSSGAAKCFIYFNNTVTSVATENAKALSAMLS